MQNWSFELCDGLAKVHPSHAPRPLAGTTRLQGFLGEPVSFQLAYRPPTKAVEPEVRPLKIIVEGDAADLVTMWSVGTVPATYVAPSEHDAGYEWDQPGIYPDVLRPASDGLAPVIPGSWGTVWFDVQTDDPARAGEHAITVVVHSPDGDEIFRRDVIVEITGVELPPLDIVSTNWIHLDSLADYYRVLVFSEEHWELIDRFMAAAAEMGANSLLTPVWTPPLDTAVGTYRKVVQLVDIEEDQNGEYTFGFDKLHRWLALCRKNGITGVEVAHLFTQWGAEKTPGIVVRKPDGRLQRAFGWDVSATDPSYRKLMAALLPQLQAVLDEEWDREHVVFHISDEPMGAEHLSNYLAAKGVVADLLEGWTIVDALSDYEYFEAGAVPLPVVAIDHIEPFLAKRPEKFWAYYCVAQNRDVSNRFIGMPSARNRAIGSQLFDADIDGFLHWGFNFYYTQLAKKRIDPFADTCAGGAFLAGDPFIVYPGDDGQPWPSIRYRVFSQAMWDHRALQAVRDRLGRDAALAIVDPRGDLTFNRPNLDPEHYYRLRQELVKALSA